MSEKRYFWLRLYDDFFTSKRIKKLRSIAGGDTYTIIYLKMQLKSLKTEGYLYFDSVMDDFAEELALDIDEKVDDVRRAIEVLKGNDLLVPVGNDTFKIKNPDHTIRDRRTQAYKEWRKGVYERDNYTCQHCGAKGKLNAHHIKAWRTYPEYRFDVANGITLCEKCHKLYHKKYGR